MADAEWAIPNGPDVKYRLGSLTKQFTAALILLLVEDGKVSLSASVTKYLPGMPKAWDQITIAELLGNTSGIPDFTRAPSFQEWAMSEHTHIEEIAKFRTEPLLFAPGTKYGYSNSNYELLGGVIEQVSGRSYDENLRERILSPLKMLDSGLDSDDRVIARHAQGYVMVEHQLRPARSESMSIPWAAGGIYSTVHDLLLWEHGLFEGKVLSQASLKRMTSAGLGGYGFGVEVSNRAGMQLIVHGGGIEGFNTVMGYLPERRIAIIILSNVNTSSLRGMFDQLLNVLIDASN